MKLTLLDIQHYDDIQFPVEASEGPLRFVTGDRETLWAEDELGRTWVKDAGNSFMPSRWRLCATVSTSPRVRSEAEAR